MVPRDVDVVTLKATEADHATVSCTCLVPAVVVRVTSSPHLSPPSRDSGPFDGKRLVRSCSGVVCPSLEHVFDRSRDPVACLVR